MNESNELIAEFMGAEKTHIESVGDMYYPVPSKTGSILHAHKLKYHKSWDWLMPVVEKIKDMECTKEYQSRIDKIDNVLTCDLRIENLYDAVVEFIKENKDG